MGWAWKTIQPQGDEWQLVAGGRYAALVSLSSGISLDKVRSLASDRGLVLTYLWEQGTPTRGQFRIDDYLDRLGADPNTSHRWVYGEGNATKATSIPKAPPWPFTFFAVSWVEAAVKSAGGDADPGSPPPPAAPDKRAGLGTVLAMIGGAGLAGWLLRSILRRG